MDVAKLKLKYRFRFFSIGLSTAWHNCVEETALAAAEHDQYSAQLGNLIVEPLMNGIKDLETARKTVRLC